jgi:phosphoglycolate phosphatase-like HAD superfamily hydrolase
VRLAVHAVKNEKRPPAALVATQDVHRCVARQLTAARSEQQRLLLEQVATLSEILGYRLEHEEQIEGEHPVLILQVYDLLAWLRGQGVRF